MLFREVTALSANAKSCRLMKHHAPPGRTTRELGFYFAVLHRCVYCCTCHRIFEHLRESAGSLLSVPSWLLVSLLRIASRAAWEKEVALSCLLRSVGSGTAFQKVWVSPWICSGSPGLPLTWGLKGEGSLGGPGARPTGPGSCASPRALREAGGQPWPAQAAPLSRLFLPPF